MRYTSVKDGEKSPVPQSGSWGECGFVMYIFCTWCEHFCTLGVILIKIIDEFDKNNLRMGVIMMFWLSIKVWSSDTYDFERSGHDMLLMNEMVRYATTDGQYSEIMYLIREY